MDFNALLLKWGHGSFYSDPSISPFDHLSSVILTSSIDAGFAGYQFNSEDPFVGLVGNVLFIMIPLVFLALAFLFYKKIRLAIKRG